MEELKTKDNKRLKIHGTGFGARDLLYFATNLDKAN